MAQKDRTYKELVDGGVKIGEMTAGEFATFQRINDSLKPQKPRSAWGTLTKGIRGISRGLADNFVEKADVTELHDRKATKLEKQQELGDLEQAYQAGRVPTKTYNYEKARLELEIEEL